MGSEGERSDAATLPVTAEVRRLLPDLLVSNATWDRRSDAGTPEHMSHDSPHGSIVSSK